MDQKFNYYDLGPKIVNSKAKYRENDSKKLTYNFVTDPRLKRGHNFGVIYVTSSNYEDDSKTLEKDTKKHQINYNKQSFQSRQDERSKREYNAKYDPNSGFGVCTEKVTTTVQPKPITFEVEVQTDPLPPKPQEKLIWPEKTGIDVKTQIQDGELFHFDEEVEPIVHVIVSKVIEESRREVLEEEEREEIKKQQKKYEKLNMEDKERVSKIEEEEKKKFEERKRKKEEKKKRIEMTKMFQMKLLSRTISKNYLAKVLINSVGTLGERGVFKNEEVDDYFTNLLPDLQEYAEDNAKKDGVLANQLEKMFKMKNKENCINRHKDAIQREKERIEKEKQDYILKKQLEEEERQRRIEEKRRRRHEKKLNEIRKEIETELLGNHEWADYTVDEIYDINGYYKKTKNVTCVGGPIGQIALLLNEMNKVVPDFITDDKIPKILELYLPKSHSFYFLYTQEDLDEFKQMNEEIAAIEDIVRCEDAQFNTIIEKIYQNSFKHDDMLNYIFEVVKDALELEKFEETYKNIFMLLMKKFKEGSDGEAVKFILFEPTPEEVELKCICLLNPEIEVLPNPNVSIPPKGGIKKNQPVKIIFDHFFSEKTLLMPTVSEKIKIISINRNFDRIFRDNFLECINKIYKLEPDKETFTNQINEDYERFVKGLLVKLGETFKKEIVEMVVMLPKEGNEGEEGEEKAAEN